MAKYASTVLSIAKNELGYLEKNNTKNLDDKTANAGSGNYTKYWRDLDPNMQGQAWCQAFVDWCFMKAFGTSDAKKLLHMSSWNYYTPDASQFFKNNGQWHTGTDVKSGDIIYFKNSTRICHVGFVLSVSGSTITTIEGNTSSAEGVVPNGGGVFQKTYTVGNSRIAGYGRPAYEVEVKTGWVQSGSTWYYRLAEGVNAHGWQEIKNADGKVRWYYFDPTTGAMKCGWQKVNDKWYYLEESGDLQGACYISDADGAQHIWVVR